jgi:LmbE family N-acetylglucosaminyl deacetylase
VRVTARKYLVVVAHPDDEALGCGGFIAKASDAGHHVTVLLATRRCDPRGVTTWSNLLAAFRQSCDTLGATSVVANPLLPETEAEPAPHRLHDYILPWVEDTDAVVTHWPGDVNQVHRGVARAVEIATRPFRRRRDVSLFEIPTSTEQGFGGAGRLAFVPNEYVVLDESQARRKCEAVAAYTGELVMGRTVDDIERRLRIRGAEAGVAYAEAFVVARRFA